MFTLSFRHDFRVPDLVSSALRPLPLLPLEIFLQQLASSIVARHPDILERIGRTDRLRFGIDPSDVPFAVEIELHHGVVGLRLLRSFDERSSFMRGSPGRWRHLSGLSTERPMEMRCSSRARSS